MNKKISLGLALSLIAVASAITFILTSFFSLQSFNTKVTDVNERAEKYNSLQTLDSYVREHYYDDIDEEDLSDGILKGYINGLGDKYSAFLNADEYQNEIAENSGELVGLGLTLTEDESGYIRIADILEDSPVLESGLVPGDIIIAVDGNDVLKTGFDKSVNSMKGQDGAEITLTIRRDGIDKNMVFTRRSIEVTTVTGKMLSGLIGYIRITGFKENTPDQFNEVLDRLTSNGARALIFDVRNNGGGLISALEKCLDPLLPEGVVATADYKDGRSETIVYSDASEINIPMLVLVNDKTASAAELFAASLKDFGKAELVGERTYGKGVMQITNPFEDGSAVILTVAEYKTVNSECYNEIGLTPDYVVEGSDDETKDDTTADANDEQYQKALSIMQQKMGEE